MRYLAISKKCDTQQLLEWTIYYSISILKVSPHYLDYNYSEALAVMMAACVELAERKEYYETHRIC